MITKAAPVSVIVPCYRCRHTIIRAVGSVANQTYCPTEIILVDDCSFDGTLELINSIRKEYPPDWVRILPLAENIGPGSARNRGWNLASQRYVAFLDADDVWHPRKIEVQYKWMEAHPEVILCGHRCVDLSSESTELMPSENVEFQIVNRYRFLLSNQLSTPSVMLKRDIPYRFMEGKRYAEDFLLWSQVVLDGRQVGYLDVPLAYLFKPRYGDSGLSGALWQMERGELQTYYQLSAERRLPRTLAIMLFLYSLIKYVRRVLVVWLR